MTTNYNNNMQPTDVSGAGNYVPSMTYDSAGRLLTRALGNGLTQAFNYYAWNQQGGRLHTLVTGTLQNLSYQYDSVGNITQIANSVAGETSVYEYDALDRLTSWQLNQNTPETYTYDAQGNLDVKNGQNLNYNDAAHKHAVTHIGSTQKYWYDDNGNQVTRIVGADTFDLAYDAENRLVEVKKNDVIISQFSYDGDGQRVKSVIDGETIRFVGGYYERKGSEITKYYMAGATRVAMRKYTIPQRMTVEYMLGDHLGSTSITTDSNGAMISEIRYKPWGETRYEWTNAPANTSPAYEVVKYQFTGQYSYDAEFGLKYYGARFYDSAVGRFVSADTVIPSGTQGYDRFAYVYNNPLRYNDPTGHEPGDMCDRGYEEYCKKENTTPPPQPPPTPPSGGTPTGTTTPNPTPTASSTPQPPSTTTPTPVAQTTQTPVQTPTVLPMEYSSFLGYSAWLMPYHIQFGLGQGLDSSSLSEIGVGLENVDINLPGYELHGDPSIHVSTGVTSFALGIPVALFGNYSNNGNGSYELTKVSAVPQKPIAIIPQPISYASVRVNVPGGSIGSFSWSAFTWNWPLYSSP